MDVIKSLNNRNAMILYLKLFILPEIIINKITKMLPIIELIPTVYWITVMATFSFGDNKRNIFFLLFFFFSVFFFGYQNFELIENETLAKSESNNCVKLCKIFFFQIEIFNK